MNGKNEFELAISTLLNFVIVMLVTIHNNSPLSMLALQQTPTQATTLYSPLSKMAY
jgi:hypothetical protein